MRTQRAGAPKMTLGELRETLQPLRGGARPPGMLFRPCGGGTFVEMDHALVLSAFDGIAKKVMLVEAGLDTFSDAERVLFILFMRHANYGR